DRLIGRLRHIDGLKIAGTCETSQGQGIAFVRLDTVAGFSRDHGRGDDPAWEALPGEIAMQPVSARAGLVDEQQFRGFAFELWDRGVDATLTRADGAEMDGLARLVASICDGDRFLVNIQSDKERGSLGHADLRSLESNVDRH